MQQNREISALFTLIDDPDEEVYSTVSSKIVEYGKDIIPNLENLWENAISEDVQSRIEMLIHRLHYGDLQAELKNWCATPTRDLLAGTLLVSKFQYPELQTTPVFQEIEKIRRNVWLELNNFLTPLEQANVISSIVYNYYNLKGKEVSYNNPDDFLIHKVLQGKKGNTISNGVLYLVLAALLDMPVRAINIPRQFVLAFFHPEYDPDTFTGNPQSKISFYVDATTGHPFTHKDIESYFKRISVPPTASYFKPLSNLRIVQILLEEVAKCFDKPTLLYKKNELIRLATMLDEAA